MNFAAQGAPATGTSGPPPRAPGLRRAVTNAMTGCRSLLALRALHPSGISVRAIVIVALGVITTIVLLVAIPKASPRFVVAAGVTTTRTPPVTSTLPPSSTETPGSATTTTPAATAAHQTSASTTTVDPGALPQSDERPTATGAQFDAGVNALWLAIVQDQPSVALPFFFPEAAYLQVKDITNPAGDYQSRLLANYDQDIHTLHAQLGDGASQAHLTGMSVPDDQAHWITPGTEYNKGSYWRVYGSTLNYTLEGQGHSFPVTSLISWRGQWYVVHLGQIR